MTTARTQTALSHSSPAPLIHLCQVVKQYQTPAGNFEALHGIDLDVQPGEFLAITGKSGAGKTTLINMITGTDTLTSGTLEVQGVQIHNLNENKRALWRGRHLGIVYQSFYLLPSLSLLDNIMLPMDFCGLYQRRESRKRAMRLLEEVEMESHAHKLPSQISGGEQQRVAIARALANNPAIIVADEPTGRLDSVTANVIFEIFARLIADGRTIVMVTHDATIQRRASRVLLIKDGGLLHGNP